MEIATSGSELSSVHDRQKVVVAMDSASVMEDLIEVLRQHR